jgi:hypothetical protein
MLGFVGVRGKRGGIDFGAFVDPLLDQCDLGIGSERQWAASRSHLSSNL